MFEGRSLLGLVVAMAGFGLELPTVSAQTVAVVPQMQMSVPLYGYGPMIATPPPDVPPRYRPRYRQPPPYPQDRGQRYRHADRYGNSRYGYPPYAGYARGYDAWRTARPYGYTRAPYYRYRWSERRAYGDTPRFTARILTPQARSGLLYEARRY